MSEKEEKGRKKKKNSKRSYLTQPQEFSGQSKIIQLFDVSFDTPKGK